VYGDEPHGALGTIARYSHFPIVPVIGPGHTHFQPIHREDLARAIVKAVENAGMRGNIYDACGPTNLTFNELVTLFAPNKPVFHIPLWLCTLFAHIFRVFPNPPITMNNVLSAGEDIAVDTDPFFQAIGFIPRTFGAQQAAQIL
jgi:uncharacterized protein YbjT (DUF2867 family)